MGWICSEFPDDVYETYEKAELETAIEHGVDYVNGNCGYITEALDDLPALRQLTCKVRQVNPEAWQ